MLKVEPETMRSLLDLITCPLCKKPVEHAAVTKKKTYCGLCVRDAFMKNENTKKFGQVQDIVMHRPMAKLCGLILKLAHEIPAQNEPCDDFSGPAEPVAEPISDDPRIADQPTSRLDSESESESEVESERLDSSSCPDSDSFVAATPLTDKLKRMIWVMSSNLGSESKQKLFECEGKLNIGLLKDAGPAQCLILDKEEFTVKSIYARRNGIPIVHIEWIYECLRQDRIVAHSKYLMIQSKKPIPEFFADLDVIWSPPYDNYDQLKNAFNFAGARVSKMATWEAQFSQRKRVIVARRDKAIVPDILLGWSLEYKAPVVDVLYLTDMLRDGQLISMKSYLLYPFAKETLLDLGFPQIMVEDSEWAMDQE